MAVTTTDYSMVYANRAAFLADGWSFTGISAALAPRDTESGTASFGGTGVSVRISMGDMQGASSTVSDVIFRNLPSAWSRIEVTMTGDLAYVPYHHIGLMLYENDVAHMDLLKIRDASSMVGVNSSGAYDELATGGNVPNTNGRVRILRDDDELTLTFQRYDVDLGTWQTLWEEELVTVPTKMGLIAAGKTEAGVDVIVWENVTIDVGWPDELDTPQVTISSYSEPSTVGGADGAVALEWPTVEDAVSYDVYVADGLDATTGFVLYENTTFTSSTVGDLAAGDYTFRVIALPAD